MRRNSRRSDAALLAALDRIRQGKSISGVQELTIENVALEAGVGRATGYRCEELRRALGVKLKPTAPSPRASGADKYANADNCSTVDTEGDFKENSTEAKLRQQIRNLVNRCVLYDHLLNFAEDKNKKLIEDVSRLNLILNKKLNDDYSKIDNVLYLNYKKHLQGED